MVSDAKRSCGTAISVMARLIGRASTTAQAITCHPGRCPASRPPSAYPSAHTSSAATRYRSAIDTLPWCWVSVNTTTAAAPTPAATQNIPGSRFRVITADADAVAIGSSPTTTAECAVVEVCNANVVNNGNPITHPPATISSPGKIPPPRPPDPKPNQQPSREHPRQQPPRSGRRPGPHTPGRPHSRRKAEREGSHSDQRRPSSPRCRLPAPPSPAGHRRCPQAVSLSASRQ